MAKKIKSKLTIRTVKRSQVILAGYNPRKISNYSREKLTDSLTSFGLVEALIWNEKSGNLIGGHQRIKILDEQAGYPENDYSLDVSVVSLTPEHEKALNLVLNNPDAAGEFDRPLLRDILVELDQTMTEDIERMTGFSRPEIDDLLKKSIEGRSTRESIYADDDGTMTVSIDLQMTLKERDEFKDFVSTMLRKKSFTRREAGQAVARLITELWKGYGQGKDEQNDAKD